MPRRARRRPPRAVGRRRAPGGGSRARRLPASPSFGARRMYTTRRARATCSARRRDPGTLPANMWAWSRLLFSDEHHRRSPRVILLGKIEIDEHARERLIGREELELTETARGL